MKRYILLLLISSTLLFSDSFIFSDSMEDELSELDGTENIDRKYHLKRADIYYLNDKYEEAYKEYEIYANKYKSSSTALKLGVMSKNGIGTKTNSKKSEEWFDKSIRWNPLKEEEDKIEKTIYRNMGIMDTRDSTQTFQQLTLGFLSLKAYDTNYFTVAYLNEKPVYNQKKDEEYKNFETKFQISVRGDYNFKIKDYSFLLTGAYTQVAHWQQFAESSPFRELNYKPEIFLTIPVFDKHDSEIFKGVSLGYKHSSNGKEEVLNLDGTTNYNISKSRSWNRLYFKSYFEYKNFIVKATLWYRLPDYKDDNPDIVDYYGYGDIRIHYVKNKLLSTLDLRYNPISHKGSANLSLSYPIKGTESLYIYGSGFTGYGYSLIDYDRKVNEVSIGISVSR